MRGTTPAVFVPAAVLALLLAAAGCASPGRPWLEQPVGVCKTRDGDRALYAVGTADAGNAAHSRSFAQNQGRQELGRQLAVRVRAWLDQLRERTQGLYDDADAEAVQEQFQQAGLVLGQTLIGSHEMDLWKDAGTQYVVMALPLTPFLEHYEARVNEMLLREEFFEDAPDHRSRAQAALGAQIRDMRRNGF